MSSAQVRLTKVIFVILFVLGAIFVLLFLLTSGEYTVPKTVEHDDSLPSVEIDGVAFHVETFGQTEDPVIIVVHGGPGDDYSYLYPLQELADEYFIVFYDQRGTGLSERVGKEELTLERSLQDLNAVVDLYRNGQKVSLVGHSFGGMLATGFVGRYPEKVDHLVLAEPGPLTSELANELSETVRIPRTPGVIVHAVKSWFESLHVTGPDGHERRDFLMTRLFEYKGVEDPTADFYCNQDFPEEAWSSLRHGFLAFDGIIASGRDSSGAFSYDLTPGLSNFKNDVLILAGECNNVIGEDFQQRQRGFFQNAEVMIIKNSGHLLFGEQPEQSIRAVRDFLDQ